MFPDESSIEIIKNRPFTAFGKQAILMCFQIHGRDVMLQHWLANSQWRPALNNPAMHTVGREMAGLIEEPDACPGFLRLAKIFRREEQFLCPLVWVTRIGGDNASAAGASHDPDNYCQEERFHYLNPP